MILSVALVSQAPAQHNALTAAEQAAGYVLLFNGTNMTNWRAWNSTTPPSGWVAAPESTWRVIQLVTSAGQAGALIMADATYQNFDFKVEWNVPSAGNSGIFSRYDGFAGGPINNAWGGASGPESQIAAINNSDGTSPTHRAGTCYDMFPLDARALGWDTPGGGFNYGRYQQFRIVAYNNHVAHFGNGLKLLEYVMGSPAYITAYNASKYATYPHYANVHPGAMYLQDHGELGIKFRDVRIKKLTQNPWALGSPYLANPNDTTSLRDLTFADNITTTTDIRSFGSAGNTLKIHRGPEALVIQFNHRGDYSVRVSDLFGRTLTSQNFSMSDQATLPKNFSSGARILSVREAGRIIHQGLLADF